VSTAQLPGHAVDDPLHVCAHAGVPGFPGATGEQVPRLPAMLQAPQFAPPPFSHWLLQQ
jgi:hypothetical protein